MYTNIATATITVADSATVSSVVSMGQSGIAGAIEMPGTLTSTAISFQVSYDGVTFTALYATGGTAISYTVAASRVIPLDPAVFGAFPYLKIVTGSSELANRVFTVYLRAGT